MPGKRPYLYYQPNQLGMRVSPKGDTPLSVAITKSWEFINGEARSLFDYLKNKQEDPFPAPANDKRQFSFTLQTDQGAVTKTFAFRGKDADDNDIFRPQDLPALVQHINKSDEKRTIEAPALEMVDLNWLSTAASNGINPGDGGPGGPPHPYPPDGDPVPYDFKGALIDLLRKQRNRGDGISVAILDTAPTADALTAAYDKWVTRATSGAPHPILKRLWNETGINPRLQLIPMSQPTKDRLSKYSIEDHPYSISDHGLFVAGIIDTLAPDATLYLYEALNDRGVCDSQSVLAGIDWIQNNQKIKRVVVNCSLFVLIPFDDKHFRKDLAETFPNVFPWNDDEGLKNWLKAQAKFSELTFQSFHTPDRTVVAAAGNDWHHGGGQNQERPLTRFPAAFDSVLGVGALEDVGHHQPAFYSNRDDNPESLGVSAFGGGLNDGKDENGKDKDSQGMIGVYISPDFPDPKGQGKTITNQNGWARWAGTSFATPLVSGLATAIMSDPLVPHTTDAPANIIRNSIFSSSINGENMLEVTQS